MKTETQIRNMLAHFEGGHCEHNASADDCAKVLRWVLDEPAPQVLVVQADPAKAGE